MGSSKASKKTLEAIVFEALSQLFQSLKDAEIELQNVSIEADEIDLEPIVRAVMAQIPAPRAVEKPAVKRLPEKLLEAEFTPPTSEYPGRVVEVKIGATKSEGGTRSKSIILGGEVAPALYVFDGLNPHPPVVSIDIFDTRIPLAKAVKTEVEDVLNDPVEWAKKAVHKFEAEVVNLHLVSIDPLLNDTPPAEAAKTVENVLQAVDVPICVGGCGDPLKDLKVFEKVCEVAEGERILINSVTLDMDYKRLAEVVKKHNHAVIAFTSMDMDMARELNRKLYEILPKESIVIDTTTAALGYGLDYAFTVMERTRLAALMGDTELQHPLSSGTTNAWAAREAWMKLDESKWGPRELRGPIWEVVTALTLLLAGVDYFMMMHPLAVKTTKRVIERFVSGGVFDSSRYLNWVSLSV
jgi:acetyl-CoA decarbonylase/synthase complex subunit delta